MIRVCPECGQANRVPTRHLAQAGRCGSCKGALPAALEPMDVDAAEFDEVINNARVPVLVDFWAPWCGPCRTVAPEVRKVAAELAGQALVLKVDTEQNPSVASRFNIRGIPHFIVFSAGQPKAAQSGALPHAALKRFVQQALSSG